MTSIHMKSEPQTPNGTNGPVNQSQSPSKFDEAERIRQRMDGLRKHHNESTEIYNRTQPIINDQIHEETMRYLKSGQVNGTKTKNQKPRAQKRQRNTVSSSNNNNNNSNNSNNNTSTANNNNNLTPAQPQNHALNSNGIHQVQQPKLIQQPVNRPVHQGQQMQQITLYPTHMQQQQQPQQAIHIQHQQPPSNHPLPPQQQQQQQQHYKYPITNGMYQQAPQTMQVQPHYQTQAVYASQPQHLQQHMQTTTHVHQQPIETDHYMSQQHQSQQHYAQQYQPQIIRSHMQNHVHQGQHFPSLPNDLDLTLQAGLECDVDSLIKHEMSVEGQLDFNHDLLTKLDNHYQPNHM